MQTTTFFAGYVANQLRSQPYPLKYRTNGLLDDQLSMPIALLSSLDHLSVQEISPWHFPHQHYGPWAATSTDVKPQDGPRDTRNSGHGVSSINSLLPAMECLHAFTYEAKACSSAQGAESHTPLRILAMQEVIDPVPRAPQKIPER